MNTKKPAEILGISEKPSELREGSFWWFSLFPWPLAIVLGIIFISLLEKPGFEGMFIPVGIALLAGFFGSFFCALLSIISILRRERNCIWGVFMGLPSLMLIIYIIVVFLKAGLMR